MNSFILAIVLHVNPFHQCNMRPLQLEWVKFQILFSEKNINFFMILLLEIQTTTVFPAYKTHWGKSRTPNFQVISQTKTLDKTHLRKRRSQAQHCISIHACT
jgi:hypothetical protein